MVPRGGHMLLNDSKNSTRYQVELVNNAEKGKFNYVCDKKGN